MASPFREPLDIALNHALTHLENLDSTSVATTTDLQTLRTRLGKPLTDNGIPADQVINELVCDVEGGIMALTVDTSSAGSSEARCPLLSPPIGLHPPGTKTADTTDVAWPQPSSKKLPESG